VLSALTKIINFEEKKDIGVLFLILLGPFFIVLTLFLTSFSILPNKDLFLFSIIGLVLCWKRRKRGLIYSLSFLVLLVAIKHFQISSHHFWQIGLELSLFIGFIIFYYSMEQTIDYLNSIDLDKSKLLFEISKLGEDLKKEEDFHERQHKNFKYEVERINLQLEEKKKEIDSYKNIVENLRLSIKDNEKERQSLLFQIKEKEQKMASLRQEIEDMKVHIITLETPKNLNQRNQELSQHPDGFLVKQLVLPQKVELGFLKEIGVKKPSLDKILLEQYEKNYQELRSQKSLYNQLKKQFEEKQKVLSDTRKELFLVNEELEKNCRERSSQELDETPLVRELNIQLGEFEEELKRMEEENIRLEEIITNLFIFNEGNRK
jgi:hypothetical protein